MLESILASVVIPAAVDLVKNIGGAASRRFVGLSADDQVKLMQAEVQKLQAISTLDNPHGSPSQWVVDLRASFRYIAAILVIGAGFALNNVDLIGMPFGFIFGERMYLGMKGSMQK